MKRISDKEMLDWIMKNERSIYYWRGEKRPWSILHENRYFTSVRDAIDAAIRSERGKI